MGLETEEEQHRPGWKAMPHYYAKCTCEVGLWREVWEAWSGPSWR